MLDRLSAVLDTGFSDHTLLVVSNREPYVHKKTREGVVVDQPAGGLTAALDDVLQSLGGPGSPGEAAVPIETWWMNTSGWPFPRKIRPIA